jgi:hypothetical protein
LSIFQGTGSLNILFQFPADPFQSILIAFILRNPAMASNRPLQIAASIVHSFEYLIPKSVFVSNILMANGKVLHLSCANISFSMKVIVCSTISTLTCTHTLTHQPGICLQVNLNAYMAQTTDVQGQPNAIDFNIASNVHLPEGSLVIVNFIPLVLTGSVSRCANTTLSHSGTNVTIRQLDEEFINIDGRSTVSSSAGCGLSVVQFRLPSTVLSSDNLTFSIRLVNPPAANPGYVSDIRIQGCRPNMVLSSWKADGAATTPRIAFAAPCPWSESNCALCNRAQIVLDANVQQDDGKRAVIMTAKISPAILNASVAEQGPVNTASHKL